MAFSYGWRGPNIVKDGLVLYLDPGSPNSFFDKTGTIIRDISGNGNNGTLTNGPTYSSSNGGVLTFDGTNDYIGLTQLQLRTLVNDLTTSIFYRSLNNNPQVFYSRYNGGYMIGKNSFTNEWKLTKYGVVDLRGGSVPLDTNWHNITVTFSSTVGVSIYLDGISQGTLNNTSNLASTNEIRIGTAEFGTHNGDISTTLMYNRALSAQEVLQNFNATRTRFGI